MYVLIMITLLSVTEVNSEIHGEYDNMMSCFDARDNILVEEEHWNGLFPDGRQAVCIKTE